jgi:hypothetical protein
VKEFFFSNKLNICFTGWMGDDFGPTTTDDIMWCMFDFRYLVEGAFCRTAMYSNDR